MQNKRRSLKNSPFFSELFLSRQTLSFFRVKFYGCKTVNEPPATACIADETRDANKAEEYRHFSGMFGTLTIIPCVVFPIL